MHYTNCLNHIATTVLAACFFCFKSRQRVEFLASKCKLQYPWWF